MNSSPKKLLVEGWLNICHSYAVVNQWQLLALRDKPGVQTFFNPVAVYDPNWRGLAGLFSPEQEAYFAKLQRGEPTDCDLVYRISFPYHFKAIQNRTAVFITSEYKILIPSQFRDFADFTAQVGNPQVKIVTPSNWSADGFYRYGCPKEQVLVVPHGVDTTLFSRPDQAQRQEIRERLGLSGFVFMHNGAMTRNKGISYLLKGFAAVAEKRPEAVLLLKGSDSLYPSQNLLKEQLSELTVEEQERVYSRCRYIGNAVSMPDMADIYRAADAYVSPYMAEGFNIPVLEAMASGLPVICTKGGSTDDFVRDDSALRIESITQAIRQDESVGEMLVPNQDHLIELMFKVMDDAAWRTTSATAALEQVQQHFTWDRVAELLLDKLWGE